MMLGLQCRRKVSHPGASQNNGPCPVFGNGPANLSRYLGAGVGAFPLQLQNRHIRGAQLQQCDARP